MVRFPYSGEQIRAMVATEKHPRDWETLAFKKSGERSRRCESLLVRADGKYDRIRLIVCAGRVDDPHSFKASLLLEDTRVRGIDYHAVARRRYYKEVIPKGWHEDIEDPNRSPGEKGHHDPVALPDFEPLDLLDFLRKVCKHWNIELPLESEMLI
ncbi:MAG: hypothetical protein KF886_14350 [Candidatus Hydrogenedentes bacterium]|nr:hypothetical protein [Candidatus Hydrogenedentota bacterium]